MNLNATLLSLAGFSLIATGAQSQASGPNIIYILADDLGYGDLSCYGQQRFTTPNIDRLANDGMRFTQHYAGSAVSAPSRNSLMTGMHTGHVTLRENRSTVTNKRVDLMDTDITIAQILQTKGYRTAIYGKWGLGSEGSDAVPNKKGFDHFVGFLDQQDAHSHYPEFLHEDMNRFTIPENLNNGRGVYANDIFTSKAKEFITNNRDNSFFLYLPYTIPHAELLVPEEDLAPYINKYLPETPYIPAPGSTYRAQDTPHAAFVGMINRMDRHIGEIMQLLDELGLSENTVIMFSSDNGPHDVGGADPVYFNGSGGLRGIKRDLYEGGIRVPFIVRWNGKVNQGSVSHHISAFWDVLPTICEITGTDPVENDGISFLPTLLADDSVQPQHDALYWEYHGRKGVFQAVRLGDYKAVRYGIDKPVELYRITEDFSEHNNIAASHPEIVNKALGLFFTMRTPNPHFPVKELDSYNNAANR